MRWKNWIPLIVAIIFGVLAAKVARDMIVNGRGAAGGTGANMMSVVVAKLDIAPGTELTEQMLITSRVPVSGGQGAFHDVLDVIGSVTQIEIPKGTEIVAPMLVAGGSGTGLQALVPPGMRAISIEVNEFSGVGGMLVPGSRVDVLVTLPSKENNGEPVSRTIVQNVKVTAVGQRLSRGEGKLEDVQFKSITLVTTPEQAEAIELATTNGRPRLVLRSGRDNAARESDGVRLAELRGNVERVAPFRLIRDPFATVPVIKAPSTQPVMPVAAPEPTTAVARRATVQLILGGVESTVMVDDLAGPSEVYSGAMIEP